MKTATSLLASLLLFTTVHSQSQVKHTFNVPGETLIGAVAFGHDILARISYSTQGADTLYRFYYLDQNYKQIGAYHTINIRGEKKLLSFYYALKDAFLPQNMPRNNQTTFINEMVVGNVDVMLTNLKRFRDVQVIFTTADGHALGLTEEQVDVLFGRKGG